MKFIAQFTFTILFAFILAQFLPFWSMAVAAFVVAFFGALHSGKAFLSGFISIGGLWLISAWIISDANQDLLLGKVSLIFGISDLLMLIIIAIVGGLLGGFSAVGGRAFKEIILKSDSSRNPYRL